MKTLHIINSLNKGGAESNLFRCKFYKKYKNNIDIVIMTLINTRYYKDEFKKIGIKVYSLDIYKDISFLFL